MFWIGIDPGKSGGIAVISDNWDVGTAQVYKMPATERDLYDQLKEIKDMIENQMENNSMFCLIENVHSFPGMAAKATFTFGYHYGLEIAFLTALQIPFERVTPQKWMRALVPVQRKDRSTTEWKNILKRKAQELYPRTKIILPVADALLLAHYNRKFHGL